MAVQFSPRAQQGEMYTRCTRYTRYTRWVVVVTLLSTYTFITPSSETRVLKP